MREISQGPDNDGTYQDGPGHLLQILLALLPGMPEYRLCGRDAVRRKFHHERQVIILHEMAEQSGGEHRKHYPEGIEAEQDKAGIMREECSRNQDIDGKPARTGHKRYNEYRDKPALAALYGPCGHHGRDIAAESHYHRDERLAVQPHPVHQLVHNERRPCHISGILQKGNEKIEEKYIGKEHKHTSDSPYYPVHHHVLPPAGRHIGSDKLPELLHQPLYPLHRIVPESECELEHKIQKDEKYREGQPFVRDHCIYPVRKAPAAFLLRRSRLPCLFQRTGYERIFGIQYGGLYRGMHQRLYPLLLLDPRCNDPVPVRKGLDDLFYVIVILQILDGKIPCGILVSDILILLNEMLDMVDAHLDLLAVVYMQMTAELRVIALVDLDDRIEKFIYPLAVAADRRHYRHAEQMAQGLDVQPVPLRLQFIVHVQGHHHPQVHVNQLRSEIEIPLEVGCIHHIHHHIRHLVYKVLPHIEFLRAVCRKGIRTRKIDEDEPVASVHETALLCIHCHSAVVPDMLVAAGSDIEKGCLAAVGIAHQGYADDPVPLLGQSLHPLVKICYVIT